MNIQIDDDFFKFWKGAVVFQEDYFEIKYRLEFDKSKTVVFVTDPPYNQDFIYDQYNDNLSAGDYISLLSGIPSPRVIIHYPEETINILPKAFEGEYCNDVLTWVYNGNLLKHSRSISFWGLNPDYEYVRQPPKNPKDKRVIKSMENTGLVGVRSYDWFNIPQVKGNSKEKTDHPCQIPVKVFDNIIKMIVKDKPEDYIIVDPFSGSGSCAIACLNNNVNFVGFELSPKYTEIANNRIMQITGRFVG